MNQIMKVLTVLILTTVLVCFAGCGPHKTGTNNEKETTDSGFHEYVDLGLPSGTLWATCNVGAYDSEEYGYYIVWEDVRKLQMKYGWEEGWRTPSDIDWVELYKNTECSWITRNGVEGMLLKAANGKSIFLPAAGVNLSKKSSSTKIDYVNAVGFYWSSSPFPQDNTCAIDFKFAKNKELMGDSLNSGRLDELQYKMKRASCNLGLSVRPVRSK